MRLAPGTRLGAYAVTASIGERDKGDDAECSGEVFGASSRDSILQVFNQSPCVGCDVSCCKEYVVQLNAHDLYRLSASVELPVGKYIELRRAKHRGGVLLEDSAIVHFYELTLAHGPRGCVFLEQKGRQLECGVHASKSGVCLGYPFTLNRGRIVQITEKLCPVDWELDREVERQVSGVIKEFRDEWFVYEDLVSEWNSGRRLDRSLSAFVTFAVVWVKQLGPVAP